MAENGAFRKPRVYHICMPTTVLNDEELGTMAKGVYAIILDNLSRDGWTLYKSFLMSKVKEGKTAFNTAWNELKAAGYLKVYKTRDEKTKRFIYEYELLEVPEGRTETITQKRKPGTKNKKPGTEKRVMENKKPDTEKRVTEKPATENRAVYLNTDKHIKKNSQKKTTRKKGEGTQADILQNYECAGQLDIVKDFPEVMPGGADTVPEPMAPNLNRSPLPGAGATAEAKSAANEDREPKQEDRSPLPELMPSDLEREPEPPKKKPAELHQREPEREPMPSELNQKPTETNQKPLKTNQKPTEPPIDYTAINDRVPDEVRKDKAYKPDTVAEALRRGLSGRYTEPAALGVLDRATAAYLSSGVIKKSPYAYFFGILRRETKAEPEEHKPRTAPGSVKNRFNNFSGRDYKPGDMESIEKRLLAAAYAE